MVYQPIVGGHRPPGAGPRGARPLAAPAAGTVPPDEFISLAEDDGLIVPLQRWVLRTATADLAGPARRGPRRCSWASTSPSATCRPAAWRPTWRGPSPQRACRAGNAVLEITESVMLDAEDRLESDLGTLRDMGCVLALDDFGRGYSSLAYLARLPVDVLKMDREFLAEIEGDERGAALVAGVIELGRALGMDVVAEGVETPGQLAALRGMACRYLQGSLLGRPMPLGELRGPGRLRRPAPGRPLVSAGRIRWTRCPHRGTGG